MNRVLLFFRKNKFFAAFMLSSISMFLMLSYSQQLSNGKYCILLGDNSQIYIPVIVQFARNIREGNNIFYSWTNSFGMNTSLLNAFSAFDPFNLIFVIFPNFDPAVFTAICIIVKTGLASACFQLMCKFSLKIDNYSSILFSVLYSMCSFQIDSNVINIIWLNSLFLLPLVFMSVGLLFKGRKIYLLSITLSYLFLTNFYMGYIVGISCIIYFILLLIFEKNKNVPLYKTVVYFLISGLISVLISSIAWVPAAYFMFQNHAQDSTSYTYLAVTIFDAISQMFIGRDTGTKGIMPDLYCGILSLIVFPFFFADKKIEKNTKLIYGIMLGFYLASIFLPPLYLFVHAFDAPDGWYFRFSFIISFLVCVMAVQAFQNIKEMKNLFIVLYSIVIFTIYLIASFIQPYRFKTSSFKPFLVMALINICAMLIWASTIILYKKINYDNKKNVYILLTFLVLFEVVFNGFLSFYNNDQKMFSEDCYDAWKYSMKDAVKQLSEDDGLYRVSYYNDMFDNSDTWMGYNGIVDFNTAENPSLRYLLTNLGVYTSTRVIRNFGTTSFTDMIFGVKYTVKGVLPYAINYSELKPYVKENYDLGFGYLVDMGMLDCELNSNPFDNNNILASKMIGDDVELFHIVDKDQIDIDSNGIDLYETGDGRYYLDDTSEDGDGEIIFSVNTEDYDDDLYMYIDNEESILYTKSFIYMDGYENAYDVNGFTSVSYLKKFEDYENIKYVCIYSNYLKQQVMNDYLFAVIDNDTVDYIYNVLSKHTLQIDEYNNGYISGRISTDDEESLLFTSVPYSKEWKIYVDNVETEITPLLNDSFIGIKLKGSGEHTVVLKHKPKGVAISIASCISGLILLILFVIFTKKRKENL